MHEQTIWMPPRGTACTEVCQTCEDEHRDRGGLPATVTGRLRLEDSAGWATCARGHTLRVLRRRPAMPAGALR